MTFLDKLSPGKGVVGIHGPVTSSVGVLGKSKFYTKVNKTVFMVSYWQTLYSIQISPGGKKN